MVLVRLGVDADAMIQMDELSGRDHQHEFLIGQVVPKEGVSLDGPRGGQVE